MDPLVGVWRTDDRLNADDETITRLMAIAAVDAEVAAVVGDLGPGQAGNGSVWAFGVARQAPVNVVLKLGARDTERAWMTAIDAAASDVVPRVFGSGQFGGVGWLVLERCNAMVDRASPTNVGRLVRATARYQHVAGSLSVELPMMDSDWLREHLVVAAELDCPGNIDAALSRIEEQWTFVVSQCGLCATHGDVHPGNAVARGPDSPALFIDPMPIRTVWAWDAAYLEANNAPHRPQNARGDARLVRMLADERSVFDLPGASRPDLVEQIVLGWAAAVWWRIAPWRHERSTWRSWVEQHVDALIEQP